MTTASTSVATARDTNHTTVVSRTGIPGTGAPSAPPPKRNTSTAARPAPATAAAAYGHERRNTTGAGLSRTPRHRRAPLRRYVDE